MEASSFFTNVSFFYSIYIFKNSVLWKNDNFLKQVENKSEIVISSRIFIDSAECEESLNSNFKLLTDLHYDPSKTNFAIISAYNPQLENRRPKKVIEDGIKWDKNAAFRIYLINADQYARNTLDIFMMGQLSINYAYSLTDTV